MLEFLFGFGIGIIVGTKCNCRPYVDFVFYTVKNTLEDIKSDFKHEKIIVDESLVDTQINEEIKKVI
jgi:hypothetical protein